MENTGNGLMKMRPNSIVVMSITYGMVVLFCIFSVFRLGSIPKSSLTSSIQVSYSSTLTRNQDHNRQTKKHTIHWVPQTTSPRVQTMISCDRSHFHYDFCSINASTGLDPTTSTFYTLGPTRPKFQLVKIRPYPRKWDNSTTMSKIKEVTLLSGPSRPVCDIQHNTTALVFTAGGYTGNFFHDFNDGFIPLFVTVRSMGLSERDVTLVIGKMGEWWVRKYGDVLRAISVHPIVNLDSDTDIHCFRSVSVGLITHGFMTINPHLLPNNTLVNFHSFLDKAYSKAHYPTPKQSLIRPKLVLFSRTGNVGRVIINQAQIKTMAEEVGFEVTVFEPKPNTPVWEAYRLMNSSHAMIGVHGAALTHLLFLRPRSVFMQVIPIGINEVAELCFGGPAKELGLDYLEYRIWVDESSLVDKYSKNDPILNNPSALLGQGWKLLNKVYLKEQNVKLNSVRFRKYLKKAYKKANTFMNKAG